MAPHPQRLTVTRRAWALARPMTTAYGVETTVDVVVAEISDGDSRGRAEGVPLGKADYVGYMMRYMKQPAPTA